MWAWLLGLGEGEAGVEVEVEGAVGVDVAVGERGEGSEVGVVEDDVVLVGEGLLDHEGVDVDEGGLEEVEAQDGGFLVVVAVGGDVAVFAVFSALSRPGSAAQLCRGDANAAKFPVRFRFAGTLR